MLRHRLSINGIVQGVGFRPFIYALAKDIGLTGSVNNTSGGVKVELQGSTRQLEQFEARFRLEAPPLSSIISVDIEELPHKHESGFTIIASRDEAAVSTLISPDAALCAECKNELFDGGNRRFKYPFINCTNCGPRYTIIENIPYDRSFTSMKHFPLCEACNSEYQDPLDRRFHAQPNACPACGPQVWLTDHRGEIIDAIDPISEAITRLAQGKILAIKGLGGFHLAVDATNPEAVTRLRMAKGRDEKPLALMVRDLEIARDLVNINKEEIDMLCSIQAPIVLCSSSSRVGAKIAPNIAPGNDRLGIMLPYTPLHHLLLSEKLDTLVMTSANFREEPICIDNDEALERLAGLAEYFLLHNRDIHIRSDDSVVMEMTGIIRPLRRSRGYAPRPVLLRDKGRPVLAVGGELKNVIALSKDQKVFLSQHIGDLENLEAYEFFQMTIEHLQRIFEIEPELIVYDLHPEYLSTKWAKDQRIPSLGVQHHHAHLASCLAENDLDEPVIGIIMDGTGYGSDGTIWGGEFLIGDASGFERKAYFEPMPLPGATAAIKSPWRIGLSYLFKTFGDNLPELPALADRDVQPMIQLLQSNVNSPLTSSCGRLFDAMAALAGGRQEIRYEAQAAIEFMQAAGRVLGTDYSVFEPTRFEASYIIPIKPIVENLVTRIQMGKTVKNLSQWFHLSLVNSFTHIAKILRQETGLSKIALSGGVFQNRLLFENLCSTLMAAGFEVHSHHQVPCNDGGLALGQIAIGQKYLSL